MRTLPHLALFLLPLFAHAQAPGSPPWRVMNDSVYAVLGLTEDQVERVKAIDQQYAQERMKLNSSPDNLSRNELDRRMSGLVADREKEMRGVLNKEQFEAWVGKRPTAKPGQRK